jgi:thiazole synthase
LSGNADTSFPRQPYNKRREQHKDVVVIGSGLAGLSAALYLSQIDPSRRVTIYEREPAQTTSQGKTVASFAAAGMLAPQSERLPKGDLLDLCIASRRMYADFCSLVETLAKESGEEGAPYLPTDDGNTDDMEPWEVGYLSSGGFLAPALAGDSVATWAPPDESGTATWLDSMQVRELEPNLHPDVVGGWWFPEDMSVDARRLTCSLRAACVAAGVQICSGPQYEITSLDLAESSCRGVWLKSGLYVHANSVLVANGAWMRNLLPVPVEPHKGQSLSLRMPKDRPPILRRVLFAQDSYIVPKADGRIVIGATVEAGSFDPHVTPAGMLHVLTHALALVPGLKDLPIEETWVGLRPTTPDKGPILGKTPWENLVLAGGYWRNGVLLAPKTGLLLAQLISGQTMEAGDEHLLKAFAWDRFTSKDGGGRLSMEARYAASMHPIHSRTTGAGVAASVGTELGSYSSARSAKEERNRDRLALFGDGQAENGLEKAFEEAAAMGKQDATYYSFGEEKADAGPKLETVPYEGSADAYTVGSSQVNEPEETPISVDEDAVAVAAAYQTIHANKSNQVTVELDDMELEERPDPGFRILHVDEESGEEREVPPYTSPGEFMKMVQAEKSQSGMSNLNDEEINGNNIQPTGDSEELESETTFDGYTTIQNASKSREEELADMRKARQQNRVDQESVDLSKIGAQHRVNGASDGSNEVRDANQEKDESSDINAAYTEIMARKAAQGVQLLDEEDEELPADPGFRIYHVDAETEEQREVPPYTTPGEFLQQLENEKKVNATASATLDSGINGSATQEAPLASSTQTPDDSYNECTLDGYTTIQDANSRSSRQEELRAMRQARQQNRVGQSGVDESKVGVVVSDNPPYGE